jgi:hypothetical protein
VRQFPSPNADYLPPTANRSSHWPLVAVIAVFTLSRVGYYIAGVRFDASPLSWFWQYIDPALLKANLGQSLWYLHSQPPAFNLFLGVVLNLFPGHETPVFAACYLLLGLTFAIALLQFLRGSGVSDVLSAIAAAVYVASPTFVLYENWLFYAYPLTVLLLLAALFFQRFMQEGRFADALLLFTCAATLALTWSLFHLVWLSALVLALVFIRRRDWRKVLAAAAVPVLVVVLWYGKNLVQVGQFTGSTWFGMNFSRITNSRLTKPERQALYDDGAISPISMIQPFRLLECYGDAPGQSTGIPVLDQEVKPSGSPNFNNRRYVDISRLYGRDALQVLRLRPVAYVRGTAEAYSLYFQPASAYSFLGGNAAHLGAVGSVNAGGLVVLAYMFIVFFLPVLLLRHPLFRTRSPTLLFLSLNVAWMTLAGNTVEVGENNRFRFATDPLVFAILVVVAVALVRRLPRASPDRARLRSVDSGRSRP